MAQGDGRSTQEVFADHLREGKEGSVEDDLVRNYAEDVVVLSSSGIHHGHNGIRELAQLLHEELPDGTFEYQTTLVDGELAFLEWAGNFERAVANRSQQGTPGNATAHTPVNSTPTGHAVSSTSSRHHDICRASNQPHADGHSSLDS